MGCLCIHTNDIFRNQKHLSQFSGDFEAYIVRAIHAADSSERFKKVLAETQLIRTKGVWYKMTGKVLIYLPASVTFQFGDHLLIKGSPQSISPPLNPDEFDYQRFMRIKGILYHHFIKSGEFLLLDSQTGWSVYSISLKARDRITRIIRSQYSEGKTQSIMLALLTGQRKEIDNTTYNLFIQTGIIHILAVSGLHVGIIYLFLLFVFRPFQRNTWSRRFSLCIKIFVLLFFAFFTGLSASVLRATLMFSVMILGRILNQRSHILNSVFLSAFILLCINPYLLFDIGFQLSYSAVTGIVLVQPVFVKLFSPKFFILNWIWQLISVSIAAQLGTLPLSLFYFKQFPTYFIIGNILAIPYVTFTIITGILIIPLVHLPLVASYISSLLTFITGIFLEVISLLQCLPLGIIRPIQLNSLQIIILSGVILNLCFTVRARYWRFIFVAFSGMMTIISIDIFDKMQYHQEHKIIVYNVPNHLCIELVEGNRGMILVNDDVQLDISKIHYHTMNHSIHERRKTEVFKISEVSAILPVRQIEGLMICTWNGRSLAIWHDDAPVSNLKEVPIDYLIICRNLATPEEVLNMELKARNIIWDSSNRTYQFQDDIFENTDRTHYVRQQGPFIDRLD
jgi:competence protein ComEC